MLAIALLFEFFDKFKHLTWSDLAILGTIAIASVIIDHLSGILGAKYGGASKKALLFGLLGFIVGVITFPPFGGILGVFVGVLVAELLGKKSHKQAVKAATGSLIGLLTGIAINLILGLIFMGLFITLSIN